MFTERMKKLELLILKRDMDDVLRYLGFSGCLHLIAEHHAERELDPQEKEIAELKGKVDSIARFLGIAPIEEGDVEPVERSVLVSESEKLIADLKDMLEEESMLLQQKLNLKQTADELSAFANLKVSFSELEHLTYLTFRLGTVPEDKVAELSNLLEKRALIVSLNKPGFLMAISPKKGRWALDSELKKVGFQETKFPADLKGVPAEVLPSVSRDLEATESALVELEHRKAAFRAASGGRVAILLYNLGLAVSIDTVKQGLASTGSVNRVSGWVPRRRFKEVVEGLSKLTQGRIAIRSFEPEELPDVASGKTKVPVVVHHGPIVRSFERMVLSYSVPLYGTIDPTPFVAVIFVLLFAIMFGDVGQAFIGVILGLLINSGRIRRFESWRLKGFGNIFIVVCLASMVTGFLYGSFFANEKFLVPATRFVTGLLTGHPVDRIITIQGSSQRIISFFGFTLAVGAIINSIGLIINIVNLVRNKKWEKALLSKTGLAGAFFFWYVLSIAVRLLLGGKLIMAVDLPLIVLPLLAIFLHELLYNLVTGKRPLMKEGLLTSVIEGIIELLESVIYYISNSVSFLRVAAFALAHAVLSFIVFTISDLLAAAPGGIVFQIIIIIIGNAIIIGLEGLIVTIQVVRLQYYEFFSKFFTESGEEFKPFTLHTSGGSK
jgi:V/A-type H+/Na+-transporting ATPase subunit I